jgi:hypothetical protein
MRPNMNKTCEELFAGYKHSILGNPQEEVSGIAYRSDAVHPGDAFFCIVGLKADGHSFAQDAINRGARVIVCERKLYLADASNVTMVIVPNSRRAMAQISARFYDNSSRSFSLVGVTGTNGKTTTTYLVEHIARVAGNKTGVIGTVGVHINQEEHPASRTTPESPDLQHIFADMRDAHVDVCAMEVSSHALDLQRPLCSHFAVTAFTNLTQDHLDYHHTFEAYFEAKALLFSREYPAKRVICIDDTWGRELHARVCNEHVCADNDAMDEVITTGFSDDALIHPISVEYAPHSTHITLDCVGEVLSFTYPLVGKFNVSNVMLACGIALQLGIPGNVIARALEDVPQIPGRLQRVSDTSSVAVFVDYAHTPDALKKALDCVMHITQGQTIVVFGCGGDRDKAKRSIMGKASLAAHYVIVTSDNPRSEDPCAIIDDIVSGMKEQPDKFEVEPDRRKAIARALACAHAGDSILIAGKGHETYQIVGSQVLHFDDTEVAREELKRAGLDSQAQE